MSNLDVEFDALFAGDQNSLEATSNGASAENSGGDTISPADKPAEMSQREIRRAKELADENANLKAELEKYQKSTQDNSNWIDTIEDEGTRELLKRTIEETEKRVEARFNPVLSEFQSKQFDSEFQKYAGSFEELGSFKEQLQKEFMRNPNLNLKARIGEIIVDVKTNKIAPIETKQPVAPRGTQDLDLDRASKDDLYALLEANKRK